MEDAATAEISRTQLWQWIHQPTGVLNDGRKITAEWFRTMLKEEMTKIRAAVKPDRYDAGRFADAVDLFERISTADELVDFLTLPAYERLP